MGDTQTIAEAGLSNLTYLATSRITVSVNRLAVSADLPDRKKYLNAL